MIMLNYFGTSLNCAGHYVWDLIGENITSSKIRYEEISFNPESLPRYEKGIKRVKGDVQFHILNGYSIVAIEGSCADKREGCKSVFFIKKVVSKEELITIIENTPIAMAIINKLRTQCEVLL